MSKKKINRIRKEYCVEDEYGHTDKILVDKVNELIGIVNQQQETIKTFEILLRDTRRK